MRNLVTPGVWRFASLCGLTFLLSASALATGRDNWGLNQFRDYVSVTPVSEPATEEISHFGFSSVFENSRILILERQTRFGANPIFGLQTHYGREIRPFLALQSDPLMAPESGTLTLLATGLIGIAGLVRRRFSSSKISE
jgi:hypothetical protein